MKLNETVHVVSVKYTQITNHVSREHNMQNHRCLIALQLLFKRLNKIWYTSQNTKSQVNYFKDVSNKSTFQRL